MNESWIVMAVVWAIAEFAGYLRKKKFTERVKSGAKWSVAFFSLILYGAGSENTESIIFLLVTVLMGASMAIPILFFRVKTFNYISNKFSLSSDDVTKEEPKKPYFTFLNWLSQAVAVALGCAVGMGIISSVILVSIIT
ncbi:hypothetical protein R5M92_16130 (plasmid) [Halomonas sp. Bachu 37]|uniref:hypothetical protein n=1 Tax=Halomonas kashgarensis TaxID=3084920 RepID=UPI003216BD60